MNVEIEINSISYLPEAHAYKRFLCEQGHGASLCTRDQMSSNADVQIYFMGWVPVWKSALTRVPRIFEYHSLSTGHLSKVKDRVKVMSTAKPAARIFLNKKIERALSFRDSVPFIHRDMGIDRDFFVDRGATKEFDLVYCGSISNRSGVVGEIERLADIGLKILLVGRISSMDKTRLGRSGRVVAVGQVSRGEIPLLLQTARAGLNFTPDIYPYNIQTSTKVLEYCASGIGIVSNRYGWVEEFARRHNVSCLWADGLQGRDDFDVFHFNKPCVLDLEWGSLLKKCGFIQFLTDIASA